MRWYEQLDEKLRDYLPDLTVLAEEPLAKHTSFRIGGPARRMAFPQNAEQLVLLLNFADQCGARPFLLGNGTNVLFPDGEVDRLIVNTRDMAGICLSDAGRVRADAGATLARVASFACQQGLAGLEFAHGIPGSVGGGVCMNAGAYGGEMAQVIDSVTVLFPDEGIKTLSCADMAFGYRHSLLMEHPGAVVLHAEFALEKDDSAAIRSRMDDLMSRRRASQPLEYPSAGSTFKRPEGHFAGPSDRGSGLQRHDRRRRAGVGKTRGLRHQRGRRHLRRCAGADGGGTAAGEGALRRDAGAGSARGGLTEDTMELLIITGMSGSGKSRAASILEDIGYYIVDNLPAEMMVKFADFCISSHGHYDRVALVYDVRAGEPFDLLIATLERLKRTNVDCRLLFLDADTASIINRYKETRRRPSSVGGGARHRAGGNVGAADAPAGAGSRGLRGGYLLLLGGEASQRAAGSVWPGAGSSGASRGRDELRLQARPAAGVRSGV